MIDDIILKKNKIYYADVGAMGGVKPKWFNQTKYFHSILFEPNISSYNKLIKNKKNNETIINSALSDRRETLKLNICSSEGSSSIFIPNYQFLNLFYNVDRFKIKKNINIDADTLDNQLKLNNIENIDFLKIDVQGFELKVLKGSSNSLKSLIGLEIECEFAQMYINQPLFNDIFLYLNSFNFHIFDLKKYYWKRNNSNNKNEKKGQLIFSDVLFLKQPESLIKEFKNNPSKLIKSIYVYMYYGYSDLGNIILTYLIDSKQIDNKIKNILIKNLEYVDRHDYKLPNFPGKSVLKKIFTRLSILFSDKNIFNKNLEWKKNHYLGNDHDLGN